MAAASSLVGKSPKGTPWGAAGASCTLYMRTTLSPQLTSSFLPSWSLLSDLIRGPPGICMHGQRS